MTVYFCHVVVWFDFELFILSLCLVSDMMEATDKCKQLRWQTSNTVNTIYNNKIILHKDENTFGTSGTPYISNVWVFCQISLPLHSCGKDYCFSGKDLIKHTIAIGFCFASLQWYILASVFKPSESVVFDMKN